MSTMNIFLPESLKSFVDAQVSKGDYEIHNECMRELTRKDQDRRHLRGLLLAGGASPQLGPADAAYFAVLRDKIRSAANTSSSE